MKNIKFKILIVLLLAVFLGKAQVKDISFTFSPAVEHTFWDDEAGLDNNTMIGGKLGFGFGEYLELRAVYMQSLDLKTNFEDFGIVGYNPNLFNEQDIDLTRWGGEFKANITTGKLSPYLTIGTGIQTIEIDERDSFEQIYASGGLGIKFKIANRAVLAIEGKNTIYNFNAGENLLSDDDKADFGVANADFSRNRLHNWSIQGSLQFYLGGRKPGTLTDLDRAYLEQFKGGVKGLQLIAEPSANYLAFDNASFLRDTWLLGGYVGMDFNEYIGIRGFYFQATENNELSLDFDNLALYGLEFRARLNDGNGVTPYLILGGGYLNPYDSYLGKNDQTVDGNEFASGGLGLNIPLGKRALITGGVRAMVSSGTEITDLTNTDDIQTHIMYNAGLKLSIGKKSKSPQDVYQSNIDDQLQTQQLEHDKKLQKLAETNQQEIDRLEQELKEAYDAKNVNKALVEQKKETQEDTVIKQNLPKRESNSIVEPAAPNLIQMSPSEFESLIERILNGLETENTQTTPSINNKNNSYQNNQEQEINFLHKRIDLLEKLLLDINAKQGAIHPSSIPSQELQNNQRQLSDKSERIMQKLDNLNQKIDLNTTKIHQQSQKTQTVIVAPNKTANKDIIITTDEYKNESIENNNAPKKPPLLMYKNTSAIVGANFGRASTANLGLRFHYSIHKSSPLEFMPEIYVGLGEDISYGASGNLIYPITIKSTKVIPYVGAGLGFANIDDNFHGNYNAIIGVQLPFLNKNLYVDYTMRNTFDYNQIAIGYNFSF